MSVPVLDDETPHVSEEAEVAWFDLPAAQRVTKDGEGARASE